MGAGGGVVNAVVALDRAEVVLGCQIGWILFVSDWLDIISIGILFLIFQQELSVWEILFQTLPV